PGAHSARPPVRARHEVAAQPREGGRSRSPYSGTPAAQPPAGWALSRRRAASATDFARDLTPVDGGGGVRANLAEMGIGPAAIRVLEHPRQSAAALARRGAHPARH